MSLDHPWEVLETCTHCKVEGAVVALIDPRSGASRFAQAAERRCRVCEHSEQAIHIEVRHSEAGACPRCGEALDEPARHGARGCPHCGLTPELRILQPATPLDSAEAARAALIRFAAGEGSDDVDAFCHNHLGGPVERVVERLVAGLPVSSSLDVMAFLFPGARGGGVAPTEGPRAVAPVPGPDAAASAAPEPPDPLQPAKLLASVAVADGVLRPDERAFAEALLRREGWPELPPEGWRVFRPWEAGPAPTPERASMLLEAAVQLSHLDHERDVSEWKVLEAWATAWGIPRSELQTYDARWARRRTTRVTWLLTWLNQQVRLH